VTQFHRRSNRLQHYDYTQNGAYFVTICSYERKCIFGKITDDHMILNECGQIVEEEWEQTAILHPKIELDAFVVMPNHIHGIIVIIDDGKGMIHHAPTRREFSKPIANSLSSIVGGFKAAVTRRINRLPHPSSSPIWQRNYHEHIIRNEVSLNYLRQYIAHNPTKWTEDSLYPET